MLCYKIALNKKVSIEQLDNLLVDLNEHLAKSHIGLQDFNVEAHMDDEALIEEGRQDLVLIKSTDTFDNLSGYFSVNKDGERDEYFKTFKKQVLGFFKSKDLDIKGVYIYEGQVINKDTKWAEIP